MLKAPKHSQICMPLIKLQIQFSMNKKLLESYDAPITQSIDLRVESVILTVSSEGGTENGTIISGIWD